MRAFLVAAALAAAGSAFAADAVPPSLEQQANRAAVADVATTGLGLAAGAAEANPLGAVFSVVAKPLMLQYIASLPEEQRAEPRALASSIWGGAAFNNVCTLLAIATGGGFAPVCIVAGIAYGLHAWQQSEPERQFWAEACPTARADSGNPDLKCVYVAPAAD